MNIPAILGDKTQHQMSWFTTDHECAIHILGQNFPGAEFPWGRNSLRQNFPGAELPWCRTDLGQNFPGAELSWGRTEFQP